MGRVYSGTRLSNLELCLEVLPDGTAEYVKNRQPRNSFNYFFQTFHLNEAAEYAVKNAGEGWGEYPAIVSAPGPATKATIYPGVPVVVDRIYVLRSPLLTRCSGLLCKLPSLFFCPVPPQEALALAQSLREKKEAVREKQEAELYS